MKMVRKMSVVVAAMFIATSFYQCQQDLLTETQIQKIITTVDSVSNSTGTTTTTTQGGTKDTTSVQTPVTTVTPTTYVSGLVLYDWSSVGTIPKFTWPDNPTIPNTTGYPANNGQPAGSDGWHTNVEVAANAMVSASSDHIRQAGTKSMHMVINPTTPAPAPGTRQSNFRAEIALYPWHYAYPLGTELWLGWSYYFPTPIVDPTGECTIHQLHSGNGSPAIDMWLSKDAGAQHINVTISHGTSSENYVMYSGTAPYSIVPQTGQWIDFVEHVVWDVDGGRYGGIYELWINGTKVGPTYNGGTTYSNPADNGGQPYGGTPKLGIYKYDWLHSLTGSSNSVSASAKAGITQMEVYIGPVRMLTRQAGNWIGTEGYKHVAPRD